jgi:hypothetical protein
MTHAELEATAHRIVEKYRNTTERPQGAWAKVINEVQHLSLDDDDELTLSLRCYNLLFAGTIAQ